nr:hypothetical protein [Tanacetum cinerariifolium]
NDEFLRNIDENMKKIIKGQVKSQVKEQVSRILPRIEESVNATLEAEVLTRSSHSSRTSEMELKKIHIENMEGNKSIQRSDEQRNLYNARKTSHSWLVGKKFNSVPAKSFSEEIRQLILSVDEVKLNHPIFNLLFDEMISDIDVLRSRVLDIIAA